jgi:DNA-directed RNA polymerase subunit RPC12/RpoP
MLWNEKRPMFREKIVAGKVPRPFPSCMNCGKTVQALSHDTTFCKVCWRKIFMEDESEKSHSLRKFGL